MIRQPAATLLILVFGLSGNLPTIADELRSSDGTPLHPAISEARPITPSGGPAPVKPATRPVPIQTFSSRAPIKPSTGSVPAEPPAVGAPVKLSEDQSSTRSSGDIVPSSRSAETVHSSPSAETVPATPSSDSSALRPPIDSTPFGLSTGAAPTQHSISPTHTQTSTSPAPTTTRAPMSVPRTDTTNKPGVLSYLAGTAAEAPAAMYRQSARELDAGVKDLTNHSSNPIIRIPATIISLPFCIFAGCVEGTIYAVRYRQTDDCPANMKK